jgi:hypothetical protein
MKKIYERKEIWLKGERYINIKELVKFLEAKLDYERKECERTDRQEGYEVCLIDLIKRFN